MQLSAWMEDRDLTDEEMASLIRGDGLVKCDRSTVTRLRLGKVWVSKPLVARIKAVTNGDVTADDILEAAQ